MSHIKFQFNFLRKFLLETKTYKLNLVTAAGQFSAKTTNSEKKQSTFCHLRLHQ